MEYKFKVGDRVWYRGGWGREPPVKGTITDLDEKNDIKVYGVECDNGESRWGYENQFEMIE